MKTLARLLLVALVALVAAMAAPATAQSQDNTAVATNTKDGKSVFKLAFSVKNATGEVDATNAAVAYASCTDCKTVAAAIQVVLVSGDVDSATPENVAIALNYDCTECETLAAAFQFVYGDGQELEFTKEGKAKLQELKKRFHDLKQRDLTLVELAGEIARIAAEVQLVVENETQVKEPGPPPATTTTTSTTAAATSTTTTLAGSTSGLGSSTSTTSTPSPSTTAAPSSSTTTSPPATVAATTTTAAP